MNDNLIILAAGASSRMKQQMQINTSLTNEELQQANKRSKALISIDVSGRPILDYLLFNAEKAVYKIISTRIIHMIVIASHLIIMSSTII